MLHDARAPRGRKLEQAPEHAGSWVGAVLVAVASSLVTLVTILVVMPWLGTPVPPLVRPGSDAGAPIEVATSDADDVPTIAQVYRRAAPAVVHVDITHGIQHEARGGAGFIVSSDGQIVTNNHVIDQARHIVVHLGDGQELPARILGRDPATDLALLKVDHYNPLPTLPLGRTDDLAVGDLALTIGSPFGFEQSLSAGYVSALGRSIAADDEWGTVIDGAIQTDAAVNPGNSGGPLLDARGTVIGITTAIFSSGRGYEGVGFAIPVEILRGILPELAERGYVQRPFLGARGVDVTPQLATMLSLPATRGVLVQSVAAGSPAEQAGLRAGEIHPPFAEGQDLTLGGDLIVSIDGQAVLDVADLHRQIVRFAVGDAVRIGVLRQGEPLELQGILVASPAPE